MRRAALILLLPALLSCGDHIARSYPTGDRAEAQPGELEGVEIRPNLGSKLPLDRTFVDDRGNEVVLGQYFGKGKPVMMSLGYYRCPMLCDLVLNGVLEALRGIEWEPGREFEMVTVSIDPTEKPLIASQKKQNYVKSYGRASAREGWHFLTGKEPDIQALANALGFYYKYDAESNEFAHAAGIFLISPDGEVTRCLRGIEFSAQTVRLSLVEASKGEQGSTVDNVLLWCFQYDPNRGTYSLGATRVMQVGGGLILIVLAAILLPAWLRKRGPNLATKEG